MPTRPTSTTPPRQPAEPTVKPEDSVDSAALFNGKRELVIRHNDDRYILRITRQGKLILNK